MSTPNEGMTVKDASTELAEQFKYEDWFVGTYPVRQDDGQDVIYFKYKKRNPERHRLYLHRGYPILMRESKSATQERKMDEACRGK